MLFLFWLINEKIGGQEYQQHKPGKVSRGCREAAR